MYEEEQKASIELVRKAKRGNRQAFGDLIKLHKEYFYRTAFLYMKHEENAMEVFQESIIQALLHIGQLKEPKYFKTWMTRIIYNCSMEMHRSNKKIIPMNATEEIIPDTDRQDSSKEERIDLHNAIKKLNEPYQTVIIQKYFEGMKISEIASQNGKPEGTVKAEVSRARKQLRSILEEGYRCV